MLTTVDLKRSLCSLFDVNEDAGGVQRVVMPLEYSGSSDRIVVRIRPFAGGYQIDENGEAAFYAALNGGDVDADAVTRWIEELEGTPVSIGDGEIISAIADEERLVAPYVFRVAEAAQQLHAIATVRTERQTSDFAEVIKQAVKQIATELKINFESDYNLPIAGGLRADAVLFAETPLIVIAATNSTRLLEAEVIHMQYRVEAKPGKVIAVAQSQQAVGKKQFERALYYTHKALVYDNSAFPALLASELSGSLQ